MGGGGGNGTVLPQALIGRPTEMSDDIFSSILLIRKTLELLGVHDTFADDLFR